MPVATACVALGVVLFSSVNALNLSAEQEAARDVGRFDAVMVLNGVTADLAPTTEQLLQEARDGGATGASVLWSSWDVMGSKGSRFHGFQTTYFEGDFASEPLPEALTLESGRWPSRPGEAVLTSPMMAQAGSGRLAVLSGLAELQIVGTVNYRYATDSLRIYAAPGTWDTTIEPHRDIFPSLSSQPRVLWLGPVDPVASRLRHAVGGPRPDDSLVAITRESLRATRPSAWASRTPWATTWPTAGLAALGAMISFGLIHDLLRRGNRGAHRAGADARTFQRAHLLVITLWSLLGAGLGLVVGLGVHLLIRPALRSIAHSPIAPVTLPWAAAFYAVVPMMLAYALLLLMAPVGLPRRARRHQRLSAQMRDALAILITIPTVLFGVFSGETLTWLALASALAAATALIAPHLVNGAGSLLGRIDQSLRGTWTSRQYQLSPVPWSSLLAMVLLAVVLPLSALGLRSGFVAIEQDGYLPDAAPGQVLVHSEGGPIAEPPPERVVRDVAAMLSQQPTRLSLAESGQGQVVIRTSPYEQRVVAVVQDPESAEQLLGVKLRSDDVQALEAGRLLHFTEQQDTTGDATGALVSTSVNGDELTQEVMTRRTADIASPWNTWLGGIMLERAAEVQGLTVGPPLLAAFSNVPDEQIQQIKEGTRSGGLNRLMVRWNAPQRDIAIPPILTVLALVPLGVLLVMLSVHVVRFVRQLRPQVARLHAVGVDPRWTRRTVLLSVTVVTLMGVMLAILCAATAVALSEISADTMTALPKAPVVAGLLTLVPTVTLGATLFALRGLTPQERVGVNAG